MNKLKKLFKDKPKREYVREMFEKLACDYDSMNDIISLGMHKSVKNRAINNVYKLFPAKTKLKFLDVCCGTGDISIFVAEKFGNAAKITGVDFSENMLEIAKKRAVKYKNIEFLSADAMNLPFETESFDIVFTSFGLRNFADLKQGLTELKRVAKKNGYVVTLDIGKPEGIVRIPARLYFEIFVPFFGRIFCKNNEPYSYLNESCKEFPSQKELVEIFREAGLKDVKNYNFACGSVAQQIGRV